MTARLGFNSELRPDFELARLDRLRGPWESEREPQRQGVAWSSKGDSIVSLGGLSVVKTRVAVGAGAACRAPTVGGDSVLGSENPVVAQLASRLGRSDRNLAIAARGRRRYAARITCCKGDR